MIYVCRLPGLPKQEPRQTVLCTHAAALRLLEEGLRREYGLCRDEIWYARGENGKPYLAGQPDVFFNITHCKGLVACVLASAPVGIDAEPIRARRESVEKRVFTPQEQRWMRESKCPDELFFRLWTLKESFVKAVGAGISYGLERVPIRMEASGALVCAAADYTFEQRVLWGEYIVSVCRSVTPPSADRAGRGAPDGILQSRDR